NHERPVSTTIFPGSKAPALGPPNVEVRNAEICVCRWPPQRRRAAAQPQGRDDIVPARVRRAARSGLVLSQITRAEAAAASSTAPTSDTLAAARARAGGGERR